MNYSLRPLQNSRFDAKFVLDSPELPFFPRNCTKTPASSKLFTFLLKLAICSNNDEIITAKISSQSPAGGPENRQRRPHRGRGPQPAPDPATGGGNRRAASGGPPVCPGVLRGHCRGLPQAGPGRAPRRHPPTTGRGRGRAKHLDAHL